MAVSEDTGGEPRAMQKTTEKEGNGQNHTTRGSNQRETKEGCAERIARCGTLSQNGYGDNEMSRAGI